MTAVRRQPRIIACVLLAMLCIYIPNGLADTRNPLKDPLVCGRPTCGQRVAKFRYDTKTQYTYAYRTHVRSEFTGSGQDQSNVYVDAVAQIHFPKACEGVLRLSEVRLRDTEQNDAKPHPQHNVFVHSLESRDLRFAYHDGLIEEICPQPDELEWALNFKRGLLSVLQNTMRRFDVDYSVTETDVTGSCEVRYDLLGFNGTGLLLRKTKDLQSCSNRYKTHSILQTVPYKFNQNKDVWPILKSTNECNITVDHSLYSEVRCSERHQVEPFSNQTSGAVTYSSIHLQLMSETPSQASNGEDEIKLRTTLLFNHSPLDGHTHNDFRSTREHLIQMCLFGFPSIKPEFIEEFSKFLRSARRLTYSSLKIVLKRSVSTCNEVAASDGREHVLSALPYIGSGAAMRIMVEEMRNKLPRSTVNNWLSSMAQIKRPDDDMLNAIEDMIKLSESHKRPDYILIGSALAHTYCRNRPDCYSYSFQIRNIVSLLENSLQEALIGDHRLPLIRERVVVLLKGIGNVGQTTQSLTQTLLDLVRSNDALVEYRLHAIYSHVRFNCENSKNDFLEIYESMHENTEIRIAAYKQVMRCPSRSSIKRIRAMLSMEEVNQVGAYVWSHMTNLAKSASPLNVEVQSLLVDENISNRFKSDWRKYSRHYEQSMFFDQYNAGARFDGDLIFGTDSYIPRTIGFNMSFDLFGESVNLFEVQTRMEGLETLVEQLFGPKGTMNSKYVRDKMDVLSNWFASKEEKIKDNLNLRYKRTPTVNGPFTNETAIAQLNNAIDAKGFNLGYDQSNPHVTISTKMFGNDVKFHTMNVTDSLAALKRLFNPFQMLKQSFSGQTINYTKSGVILDITYTIPMVTGMPLSLEAYGASSADFRMSGTYGNNNSLNPLNVDISGRLNASAALEITCSVITDYFLGDAGIRVKGNMHTNTAVNANLRIIDGRLGSLKLNLPQDRNDIFGAHSKLLVIRREVEVAQAGIAQRAVNATCTSSLVEMAIGLKVCTEYSVPDLSKPCDNQTYPSLLLSGPVSFKVGVAKADLSAKTFLLEYRWYNTSSNWAGQHGSLTFSTPNSKFKRLVGANVTIDAHNINATMSLENGPLNYLASAQFLIMPFQKRLNFILVLNGKKKFSCEMGYTRNGNKYIPFVELSINEERIVGLTGTIKQTIKEITNYNVSLEFQTKRVLVHLDGYLTQSESSIRPKFKLKYLFQNKTEECVDLEMEFSAKTQQMSVAFGHIRLNSTAYPRFNFDTKAKFVSHLGHIEGNVYFNNADDLIDPVHTLHICLKIAHYVNNSNLYTKTSASFDIDRLHNNIDLSIQLDHQNTPDVDRHMYALLRLSRRNYSTVLSIRHPRQKFYALGVTWNITVPQYEPCTASVLLTGLRPKEYSLEFKGNWFTGHNISGNGLYRDLTVVNVKQHRHLKLFVKSPHFNDTNVELRHWIDNEEWAFVADVTHGDHPYSLEYKLSQRSEHPQTIYVALTLGINVYSIRLLMQPGQYSTVTIHIDNIRDIQITLRGQSIDSTKEYGFEVQWDANRDPTAKLSLNVFLNTPDAQHWDGGILAAYQDRSISGSFDLATDTDSLTGKGRVAWSQSDAIAVKLHLGGHMQPIIRSWLFVDVRTPFDDWTSSVLSTDLLAGDNRLYFNGSLQWADQQHVGALLSALYKHTQPSELLCELRTELNSTVPEIPTLLIAISHNSIGSANDTDQSPPRHRTEFKIQKGRPGEQTAQIVNLKSQWTGTLGRVRNNRTVQGSVIFRTSMFGYRWGGLYAKYVHNIDQPISGTLALDLESQQYRAYLSGYMRRMTDNMLSLNITTPIERFASIMCRLGASQLERHAVAEIRLPHSALGVEFRGKVEQLHDFDLLLSVESPLEGFQRMRLVAKMQTDTMDMQCAWNRIVLGYVSVHRFRSYDDMEYSYKLLTAIEGYETNGVVLRYIHTDVYDVELSAQAKHKIGISVKMDRKPPLGQLVGTQPMASLISTEAFVDWTENEVSVESSGADNEDDEDFEDDYVPMSYVVEAQLNTLAYPTIVGKADIDEIGDSYIVMGQLKLPFGTVNLTDHLLYPDYFNISNTLNISTPFGGLDEVHIRYLHDVAIGYHYAAGIDVSYGAPEMLTHFAADINHSKLIKSDEKMYDVIVQLQTPLARLETVMVHGRLEIEKSVCRTIATAKNSDTSISVASNYETGGNILNAAVSLQLDAPDIESLDMHFYLNREQSDIVNNTLAVGFELKENNTETAQTHVRLCWHNEQAQDAYLRVELQTNLCAVSELNATGSLLRAGPQEASVALTYRLVNNVTGEYLAHAIGDREQFVVAFETPAEQFGNVSLRGNLKPSEEPGGFSVQGTCIYQAHTYPMDGLIHFDRDVPVDASLRIQNSANGRVAYRLANTVTGYGKSASLEYADDKKHQLRATAELSMSGKIDWFASGQLTGSDGLLSGRTSLDASMRTQNDGSINSELSLRSPWEQLQLDAVQLHSNVSLGSESGWLRYDAKLPAFNALGNYSWTLVAWRDLQATAFTQLSSKYRPTQRFYDFRAKYQDNSVRRNSSAVEGTGTSQIASITANVNERWNLEASGTYWLVNDTRGGTLSVRFPEVQLGPVDVHKLRGKVSSNFDVNNMDLSQVSVSYDADYETDVSRRRFSSRGEYRNLTDLQGLVWVKWGIEDQLDAVEANVQMLRKDRRREYVARIVTPWHKDEDTFRARGSYDVHDLEHVVNSSLHFPASQQIANASISFISLENIHGSVNCSTPFANLSWIHGDIDFHTHGANSKRYLKATWPTDHAFFDLKNTYRTGVLDRNVQGIIDVSVPLTTRHMANVVYAINDHQDLTNGDCTVNYNGYKVMNGSFTCKSDIRAGFENEVYDITLENPLTPIGITYVHTVNFTDKETNSFDKRRAKLFTLDNKNTFNITGELHTRNMQTGQDIKIIVMHDNHDPIVITTMNDIQERQSSSHARIDVTPDVWLAYKLQLLNNTDHLRDAHELAFEFSYPLRNLSVGGLYEHADNTFDADLTFNWTITAAEQPSTNNNYDYEYELPVDDDEIQQKSAKASVQWRRYPTDQRSETNQTLGLFIQHSSFAQDVSVIGALHRNDNDLFGVDLQAIYTSEPEHEVQFSALLTDLSSVIGYSNYTYAVNVVHGASNLDVHANGFVSLRPGLYTFDNVATYKRSYLPEQAGFLRGKLNVPARELQFWRKSPHKTYRVWAISNLNYPVYNLSGLYENSTETKSSGVFYINFDDKKLRMDVNMTPDATQAIRMYGEIPDARGVVFDLYRQYEELRVVDLSYYLRMNHSRLITSKFIWRPTLRAELIEVIRETIVSHYYEIMQEIDYWKKTMYYETKDSLKGVWSASEQYTDKFVKDISGLQVLQNDLKSFQVFVNESYNSNDFYLKSMVNVTMTVLDKLSLRSHINSLPKILTEIWQLLGDTGKAIYNGMKWALNSLSTSYDRAIEMVGRIFNGAALDHITGFIEQTIIKYDSFVKDLHLKTMKFLEQTWTRVTVTITRNWQAAMRRFEPVLIQFYHYIETMTWTISKEILDFLNKRSSEIVDSPYFNKVSNFTSDIDRLYRDIVSHDFGTNVRKYSRLAWQFIRTKYFALVPFSNELTEISNEMLNEIRKLQELEPVQYVVGKIEEVHAQITWFANELQVEKRMLQLWTIIEAKFTTLTQTGLETEDQYREAKTKFIYDPDVGRIELEQKLPMSWHSFNDTPIFKEIPEYKKILSITSLFQATSNFSLWDLYNKYRLYSNPNVWLPPYSARGVMIGTRHYVTFDERFIRVQHSGANMHLLAHDFRDEDFSLIIRPHGNDYKLKTVTLISDDQLIEMHINGTNVRIVQSSSQSLPLRVGPNIIVTRVLDILSVESSRGFSLSCNLQFDVCWFELNGWYFGRSGGVLGNMNNELYDDYRTPLGQQERNDGAFMRSWMLQPYNRTETNAVVKPAATQTNTLQQQRIREQRQFCDAHFRSSMSPFFGCFRIVDAHPYLRMCLDLADLGDASATDARDPTPRSVCSVALAYIDACQVEQLPLRIPTVCINCELRTGDYVPEGTFINVNSTHNATDIVFLVEYNQCNHHAFTNKNLAVLINTLERELIAKKSTSNRYAVLAFGGSAPPFDNVRTIVHDNRLFAGARQMKHHFEFLRQRTDNAYGNASVDHLAAIGEAAKLTFRPAVLKAFIMLQCTPAKAAYQDLDYSSVAQQLREDSVQLHVLMNQDFAGKQDQSNVFGIDRNATFTKENANESPATGKGQPQAVQPTKHFGLPKRELGLNAALAMESSGSIFTASKLRTNMPNMGNQLKKFATVFARRVAEPLKDRHCQTCECSGHDSGVPYMTCILCHPHNSDMMDCVTDVEPNCDYDEIDVQE